MSYCDLCNGECAGHLAQSKPLCDTTMTPRNPAHLCCCVKRTDEMGPCDTCQVGMGGRCVFCDHEGACHGPNETPRNICHACDCPITNIGGIYGCGCNPEDA